MNEEVLRHIRECALSNSQGLPYPPVSEELIDETESQLGFQIPPLLRACYEQIGNGGFGPGYGLIGLSGGARSDFGSLVETHHQLKSDQESEGNEWQFGLLPFCSWGCIIFSCVDCTSPDFPILTFEDFEVWPQSYDLEKFFSLWLSGVDILSLDEDEVVEVEGINPFTGKPSTFKKRTNR